MLFLASEEGFFHLIKTGPVEREILRALAYAGNATLISRHIFGRKLGNRECLPINDNHIVFCDDYLGISRGVNDVITRLYATIGQVEKSKFWID